MPEVELSAGTVEYTDTGGNGPVLVFLHGLTMDGTVWRHVVERLHHEYRCVLPTLPLGGHRRPMNQDADLSLTGLGHLIGEFLEAAGLHEVTLIQNDWGGAQMLIAAGSVDRVARLVITSSEAFENYPPKPARPLAVAARIPGGLFLVMQALRLRAVRRAPGGWGWMSKRPVPKDVMDGWFRPATTNRHVRRDLGKYARSVPSRTVLLELARRSSRFERPVLIVWAVEDRMMPVDHGRRLARLFPDARFVGIADSYTLIPEDQPEELARVIAEFVDST